jgi:hypothetical protein
MEPTARPKTNLRDDIEEVFSQLGGPSGMIEWVRESTANKRIFFSQILPRCIPRETKITGGDGGPMRMVVSWAGEQPPQSQMKVVEDAVLLPASDG